MWLMLSVMIECRSSRTGLDIKVVTPEGKNILTKESINEKNMQGNC